MPSSSTCLRGLILDHSLTSPLRSVQTVPVTAGGVPVSDRPFTRTGLLGFVGPVSSPTTRPRPLAGWGVLPASAEHLEARCWTTH